MRKMGNSSRRFGFCLLPVSSWGSLVAQMVKNLPAMQEIQLQSLGQEDPLEKGMATHSMDRRAWWATVYGSQKVGHD